MLKYLSLFLLFVVLGGCSNQNISVMPKGSNDTVLLKNQAEEYFLIARDYERRGYDELAFKFYDMAYELDPSSNVLKELLLNKSIATHHYDRVVSIIKGNKSIDELNIDEKRLLADSYLKLLKFDLAIETLEQIPNLSAGEYYSLGLIYESKNDIKNSIKNYVQCFDGAGRSLSIGLKIADLLSKSKQFSKAESLYVVLQNEFGETSLLFNGLGTLKLAEKDTATALNLFKTASLLDTTFETAKKNIANIKISQGNYKDGISIYKKLYEIEYNLMYGRMLAMLYYYDKEYDKAESLLIELISKDPDNFELHFYLGAVFFEKNNVPLSEVELEKAISINKKFVNAWQQLCYVYIKTKQKNKALNIALKFTNAIPENALSWQMLGNVYNIRKEYDLAINALKQSLKLDPNNDDVWFELGSAFERNLKYRDAEKSFKKALSINPNNHEVKNYLGYMWADRGVKLDDAEALLKDALQLRPNNGAYLDSYAWILFRKKRAKEALYYIKKAVSLLKTDPVIYYHLGNILEINNKPNLAIKAYEKCLLLGWNNSQDVKNKILNIKKLQ